jgi:hypothetical protein
VFRRTVILATICIGLVAIVVYEGTRVSGTTQSNEETEVLGHAAGHELAPSAANVTTDRGPSVATRSVGRLAGNDSETAGPSNPAANVDIASRAKAAPSTESPERGAHQTASESGIDLATALVGRPFPVSNSVAAGCKADGCPELDQALAKFADEPRDPVWASKIEEKLREFIATDPQYTVRNLECRSTLCFAEVTSILGGFNDGIKSNDSLHGLLYTDNRVFGYERDPSSGRITVTLVKFSEP